jgi:hypothetical protein
MSTETLKTWLEYVECAKRGLVTHPETAESCLDTVATAIREAIATERLGDLSFLEPRDGRLHTKLGQKGKQDPYGWVYVNKYGIDSVPASKEWCETRVSRYGGSMFPLYTAELVHEPVAWTDENFLAIFVSQDIAEDMGAGVPLYTAPPAAQIAFDFETLYNFATKYGVDYDTLCDAVRQCVSINTAAHVQKGN